MRIDLHTHSRVSDGTDTPEELVAAALASRLDVVALTDHDTFDGLASAEAAGRELGISVLGGIEISAQRRGRSVHLLGYRPDRQDPALGEELRRVRAARSGRVPQMLAALAGLGIVVDTEVLARIVGASPSVGRPHLADALVAQGVVADRNEAFARYFDDDGPAFVPRYSIDLPLAIDLVHDAGGVAVLAHPWGRGRRADLPESYIEYLVENHGLDGIEAAHQDHDPATTVELQALAARLGLLATGSSDYHGTGKTGHPLGVHLTAPAVLEELLGRLGN